MSKDRPEGDRLACYGATRRWLWLLAAAPPLLWAAAIVGIWLIVADHVTPLQQQQRGEVVLLILAAISIPLALSPLFVLWVRFVRDVMPDETTRLRDVIRRDLRGASRPR